MSMRVLVAFEDIRTLYRELLVKAILDSRPTLNVRSVSLDELAGMLLHLALLVVVCSHPNDDYPPGSGAWVEVPTDDPDEDYARLAQMCLDGEHWWTEGPPLSEVLAIIGATQERLEAGRLTGDC
jgi:hypothetical protein